MRGRYVADLFAGSGGVSRAIRNMGFSAREWELPKGDDHDLTKPAVVFKLQEDIRHKKIIAVMMAPPCSSFSRARDRTKVIRSPQFPFGVPGLSEQDAAKVNLGNACFATCVKLIRLLNKYDIPWILENPHSSKCWYLPSLQRLSKMPNVYYCVTYFCCHGTKWRKRTRLMVGNIQEQDAMRLNRLCTGSRGICGRANAPHHQLTGSGPGGIPWTRIAQPYPKPLCRDLAHVLLARWRVVPYA